MGLSGEGAFSRAFGPARARRWCGGVRGRPVPPSAPVPDHGRRDPCPYCGKSVQRVLRSPDRDRFPNPADPLFRWDGKSPEGPDFSASGPDHGLCNPVDRIRDRGLPVLDVRVVADGVHRPRWAGGQVLHDPSRPLDDGGARGRRLSGDIRGAGYVLRCR